MTKNFISPVWLSSTGLCLLAGCQSAPLSNYPTIAVSRVISGQSIEWVDKSQQPPVILQGRLAGIDAPSRGQNPWGEWAKTKLTESIAKSNRSPVQVEFEGTPDKFGRSLVYLWQDGRLLNEELVKAGYVLPKIGNSSAATPSRYRERLIRASQYARLSGQGIWNPDLPMRMSPAEFRKEEQ